MPTLEEVNAALLKQGVPDYKKITIRKGGEEIVMNAYILSFNQSKITKEVKIGYGLERLEQYISHSWGVINVSYGHHRVGCRRCQICGRCGQKDPDHMEDCPNETKCPNCQENYSTFSRLCDICKKKEGNTQVEV